MHFVKYLAIPLLVLMTLLSIFAQSDKELKIRNAEARMPSKDISIYFKKGSSLIEAEYLPNLQNMDSVLSTYSKIKLELGGHSRCSGNSKKDAELSMKRASAVKAYFIKKGIGSNRLLTVAYGNKFASCPCKNKDTCSDILHAKDDKTTFKILSID